MSARVFVTSMAWNDDGMLLPPAPSADTILMTDLPFTGTPDGTRFLRDDGVWASPGSSPPPPPSYTDENAQDAVGGILTDSSTIDFTYSDGTPSITAAVKTASLDLTHFASGIIDTDGTLAADSDSKLATQKAVKTYVDAAGGGGSGDGTDRLLNVFTADPDALDTVSNTTSATPFSTKYTLPGDEMALGTVFRVTMWGLYSTAITAPGIQIGLQLTGTGGPNTTNLSSATLAGSVTDGCWQAIFHVVCTDYDAGTLRIQGSATFNGITTTGAGGTSTITIDPTEPLEFAGKATWSVANAGDSITLVQMLVERMTYAPLPPVPPVPPPPTSCSSGFRFSFRNGDTPVALTGGPSIWTEGSNTLTRSGDAWTFDSGDGNIWEIASWNGVGCVVLNRTEGDDGFPYADTLQVCCGDTIGNNECSTAITLTSGVANSGVMETTGGHRWFKFTTSGGTVSGSVDFGTYSGLLGIQVYGPSDCDDLGDPIDGASSPSSPWTFGGTYAAGTYRIQLEGNPSSDEPYSVTVTFP